MKLFIRYWRDEKGQPRGTMVATLEHRVDQVGFVAQKRMIYGWSFCHKKDMRNGLFSKRAGRAYAFERMLRNSRKQNFLPAAMKKAWDLFRQDAWTYFNDKRVSNINHTFNPGEAIMEEANGG